MACTQFLAMLGFGLRVVTRGSQPGYSQCLAWSGSVRWCVFHLGQPGWLSPFAAGIIVYLFIIVHSLIDHPPRWTGKLQQDSVLWLCWNQMGFTLCLCHLQLVNKSRLFHKGKDRCSFSQCDLRLEFYPNYTKGLNKNPNIILVMREKGGDSLSTGLYLVSTDSVHNIFYNKSSGSPLKFDQIQGTIKDIRCDWLIISWFLGGGVSS